MRASLFTPQNILSVLKKLGQFAHIRRLCSRFITVVKWPHQREKRVDLFFLHIIEGFFGNAHFNSFDSLRGAVDLFRVSSS